MMDRIDPNMVVVHAGVALAGFVLGLGYFLWVYLTTRRLVRTRRADTHAVIAMLMRPGLGVALLWLLSDGHWTRLATALAGFVIARTLLVRWLGASTPVINPEFRHDP